MDSEFSEFSYGFAAASELADTLKPLKAAPIFPSLIAEAKLGWDLKLQGRRGVVLFVQFKIPFACTRASALEWSTYGTTYYRLYIRRLKHSHQHNRLKRLSKRRQHVYYLAPRFYQLSSFNQAYLASTVLTESVAFPLRSLPTLNDDKQHYICYQTGADGLWCSNEPEKVKAELHEALIRNLATATLEQSVSFSKEELISIRRDLLFSIPEVKDLPYADIRGFEDTVRDIVHLGRTYFNAEPIFLTNADETSTSS